MRTRAGKFKTPYTSRLIISYLKSVNKLIGKSPTYRDLSKIPGPSPRTVIRHFGTWTKALKASGIRPQTNQLMRGEKTFIRRNWKCMSDKEIASKLGISIEIIKYYRIQYNLWKNRKGTSDQKHKKDGMRTYGQNCEVCNFPLTELHHIIPKSTNISDWAILCPNCHAVITRRQIKIKDREELNTKLKPFMKNLYKNLELKRVVAGDSDSV